MVVTRGPSISRDAFSEYAPGSPWYAIRIEYGGTVVVALILIERDDLVERDDLPACEDILATRRQQTFRGKVMTASCATMLQQRRVFII